MLPLADVRQLDHCLLRFVPDRLASKYSTEQLNFIFPSLVCARDKQHTAMYILARYRHQDRK